MAILSPRLARIGCFVACTTLLQPTIVQAYDPSSVTFSAICDYCAAVVITSVEESQEKEKLRKQHVLFLKKQTKLYFLEMIEIKKLTEGERFLLRLHEFYRYPNFIEALKEACPSYSDYIKLLIIDLLNDTKKRKVEGFEVKRNVATNSRAHTDLYYEFFELIKTLYLEITQEEEQELTHKKNAIISTKTA